jgi:thiamine-phosphate pyrophosphorylase
MKRRHPAHDLPRLWLMTDERQGAGVTDAVAQLPRGAGVIFRHHATAEAERRALFERVRRLCRKRGLTLVLANDERQARHWRADGAHHREPGPPRIGTASAHDIKEIRAAERSGAALILLSPVYPTRSHPGAKALGSMRFAALLRSTQTPVIALGGMDRWRARQTAALGAYGWAAIDAWS